MAEAVNDPQDWKLKLSDVQYVLNNTFHKAIDTSPSYLLLGYDQLKYPDKLLTELLDKLKNIDLGISEKTKTLWDCAKVANRTL